MDLTFDSELWPILQFSFDPPYKIPVNHILPALVALRPQALLPLHHRHKHLVASVKPLPYFGESLVSYLSSRCRLAEISEDI